MRTPDAELSWDCVTKGAYSWDCRRGRLGDFVSERHCGGSVEGAAEPGDRLGRSRQEPSERRHDGP